MKVYRLILPEWAQDGKKSRVLEGCFNKEEIRKLNDQHYNVYYLPNGPTSFTPGVTVDGSHINRFEYVFVDMDLKDGRYASKELFVERVSKFILQPTSIVDSGNGIHVYWKMSDLDASSYLKLQRRLLRLFETDESIATIYQLMREVGTVNWKDPESIKLCDELQYNPTSYTCEQMDKALPKISFNDAEYCKNHYDKTYNPGALTKVDDRLPAKFAKLLKSNSEVKELWANPPMDRSKADYRLGHLMFANEFTRAEAMSVLVNASKALERSPVHRVSYAEQIVDKIWTYELADDKSDLMLSSSVTEILSKTGGDIKGTRFRCHSYLDATAHGFRLGQIIGLVAGSGVGKTAMALNMFEGFVRSNPDYIHFFIPLEQPANEIADRWRTMCGANTSLYDKVHVISNYDDDGSFRHLSFNEIRDYLLKFKEVTGKKIGCVVIDHIGALNKKGKQGEQQDLMDICHSMKAFAVQLNVMLVMQSQAPREKAGIGDLELNKDAAYGTVYFESYCDYLVTIWQPLKRCYSDPSCPTVTAFKFCKIRHKKRDRDDIQEDVCYRLYFDSNNERMRELTSEEEEGFTFWDNMSLNKRKADRKTDAVPYQSIGWTKDGKADSNQNPTGSVPADRDAEKLPGNSLRH